MRAFLITFVILAIYTTGVFHNAQQLKTRSKRDLSFAGDSETVEEHLRRARDGFDPRALAKRRKRFVYRGSKQLTCWTYYSSCWRCQRPCPNASAPPVYQGPTYNKNEEWIGLKYGCKCNAKGSLMSTCDIKTGQCRCKPHNVGRSCDQCEGGYWNATEGCERCDCNADGSRSENCDQTSGNCLCKPGVQGKRCDSCKPLHYGFSNTGCKACDICNKQGHICHPDTGRCVCPPNSHGASCHLCTTNTWGHEPQKGCKKCECSATGSVRLQCNLQTGECQCQQGYVGEKCDQCDHGYYGYPKCKRCNCNLRGTDRQLSNCTANGICQCNSDGSCPCKKNVSGRLCNTCKEGNFGLHADNPDGCTECFCFRRSKKCEDAGYSWTKIRTPPRNLTIEFNTIRNKRQISNDIIDLDNFEEIPSSPVNITRTLDNIYIPLYWKLPKRFYGDRILSYSGHLRFTASTNGTNLPVNNMFSRYPVVRLEGNGFKLTYQLPIPPINNKYEVRLHESLWKRIHSDSSLVTRELLMLTLQNVTGIFIKASDFSVFEHIILTDVSLDSATEVAGRIPPLAQGIEKCFCDTIDEGDFKYNGTSCQNPGRGFYRHKPFTPANHHVINIEEIIGESVRCKCNNRTSTCDIETGNCLGCSENTTGNACERCAQGFYGDPMIPNEKCKPCACPSVNQNFAKSCTPIPKFNKFICQCKTGYTGQNCNTCSPEYYGQPDLPNGSCKPCNCDKDGSLNNVCDPITGECSCKKGITGSKCSKCEESRHILENNKCIRCNDCIQMLLDDLESMSYNLMSNTVHLQNGTLSPPWEKLNAFKKRHIKLEDLFEDYDIKRDQILDYIDSKDIESVESNFKSLDNSVEKEISLVKPIYAASAKNKEKAEKIGKEIEDNKRELNELINYLYEFGKSKINAHEALKNGKQMLQEIQSKYTEIDNMKIKALNDNKHCKKISDWANNLLSKSLTEPLKLKKELTSLKNRYKDLDVLLEGIKKSNEKFDVINEKNAADYLRISQKLANLEKEHGKIQELIKQRKEEFNQTFELLNNIEKHFETFTEELYELHSLNEQLKKKEKNLESGIQTLDFYKFKIDKHVADLEKNISDYNRIFNFTSKELDAVKASERFTVIIETLEKANKTLHEAMDEFEENVRTNLNPEGTDSIYDKTAIANANSDRLIKRVEHLKNQIKQALSKLHRQIPDIEGNNWRNGINNNAVTEKVIQLIRDNKSKGEIEAIIEGAKRSTIEMRGIYKEVTNINISMQHELLKKHQKCLNLTSPENVKMTENDIDFVKKLLLNASKSIETINMENVKKSIKDQKVIENDRFLQNKTNLEETLKNLRALVMKTQQVAATISVALTGDSCSRTYKVKNLEPTIFTKINVQFTYGGKAGDLFSIKNSKQYMNLRVEQDAVVLLWKFDKTEYNISVQIRNSDIDINIERINNILTLNINSEIKQRIMNDTPLIFNVNTNDLLRVGMDISNKATGIPGCLKQIAFNNRMIGLWEFEKSNGNCAACSKNNTIIVGPIKYRFNGKGYAMTKIEKIDVSRFNIKLNCKTFDENALIFLAYYDSTYLSITLQNGKIAFEMVYKNPQLQPITGSSEVKYNNGKEFSIELSKLYNRQKKTDLMTFKINDVAINGEFVSKNVNSNDILKIKRGNLHFGGIPPDVSYIDEFKKYPNFLGILSEVTSENAINLQDTQNYGISFTSDNEMDYRKILFEQNGYLTLKPEVSITNGSIDFSFVLRTEIENGFIMSLVDENSDLVIFEMESGMLQVSQPKSTKLLSNEKINDDQFYLVHLSKRKKNATLSINGIEQMRTKVQSASSGKPITLNIGGLPNQTNSFKGIIKDIVLNNELLTVNAESYVTAEGAMIGRSKREATKPKREEENYEDNNTIMENVTMKDMQQIDGCDKINYSLEPNAVKFGDAPNSYVKRSIKESFWKRDFSIDFEFRSFYKNGILFIAQGGNDYYLLQMRGGKVELHINGKRRKNMQSNLKIDDGNWHQVSVQCTAKHGRNKKKLMIMAVDGDVQKVKVPPNKVSGNLFFGDIDKSEKRILDKLEPFRGCIRSLKINNAPQGLINDKNTVQYYNIGQCFPNIEKGSYFRGDSFALHNSLFRLSNSLEFSFNFRTSELNGVLVSVSNVDNSPALSIELQNGAVVMSVDMGSGTPTKVTNNLPKYTICNNKWHHVSAKLSTELTVIVDGVEKSWVLSEMGFSGVVEAPLYIGGLPDSAPAGTLKIRENFKGCINNLTIGSEYVDWINMEDLKNVALNSCPVVL